MSVSRGFVLLLSLWTTATLTGLAVVQATRVSLELRWAGRMQEEQQAWDLAWGALQTAAQQLARDPEPWTRPTRQPIVVEGGSFQVSAFDEQARLALNAATQAQLLRLPGFTPASVAVLLANRTDGKLIAHLSQLTLLPGFDGRRLSELEPLVTVHGTGAVNVNTASQEVLILLGISPSLASGIVTHRQGTDGMAGTPDDRVLMDLGTLVSDLEAALGPLRPDDQTALPTLISAGQIGVGSSLFRVEAEGISQAHGVSKKVTAVIERTNPGHPPVIKGWRES